MTTNSPDRTTTRRVASRRTALLAAVGIGALGAAGFGAGPFQATLPAQAQTQGESPSGALTLETPDARVPSFADVVERVRPAVVSVRTRLGDEAKVAGGRGMPGLPPGMDLPDDHPLNEFFERFRGGGEGLAPRGPAPRRGAQGSGFFITGDGYLVTNNHVVERAETVEVLMDDGTTLDAEIVGTDPKTDLALLKVEERDDPFAYVEFAPSAPRVGDWVVAIGNPFGLGGTVTAGIVSARGRDIGAGPYDDFLQIDAPVNQGNSGGPAFDQSGQVIGVNTAISSPTGGNVGIAFAIPSETVQRIVAQLRETGEVERGFLGVQIQPVNEDIAAGVGLDEARGAIVGQVTADSPAAEAGLEVGDIVLEVAGEDIEDARDLSRTVAFMDPGESVEVVVFRDGERQTLEVTIGRMPTEEVVTAGREPEAQEFNDLGLQLAPVEGDMDGVAVVEVDPDGPAFEKGIAEGDVIAEVGGEPVANPQDVETALSAAAESGREAVLVRVERDGASRFIAFRLPIG
ncbi:Do family serine endopeptidase [Salinarimonas ramus]|uniref:Probable periplasmic serine endoprotease DegP-like n=1 Tax=Salinarimonas ramus TaxID=690164 RepID=A0A917V3U7_9HYPH|nr:Do family serine endopeptidase [Salinarimonas ramus]GGK35807.1 serine peptidase [Salinarimonas ramus]